MDLRLDGKTAIVTGGSRGIGKAIAAAAVYLAAESSSWVTGHTIVLDGGGLIAFPR